MIFLSRGKSRTLVIGLVVCALVLAGLSCGPAEEGDELETLPQPTNSPEPTTPPEPTPTPTPLSCDAATFDFGPAIAAGISAVTIPADTSALGADWAVNPEYPQYGFTGYVLPNTFHNPEIRIYDVDEYVAIAPTVADVVTNLQQLLANMPADPNTIPLLPIWNAAQLFRAKVAYVTFQNGSGVRFLTQYGQAFWFANNHDMFYAFQGLTNDGSCYVSAILPISNPALPNDGTVPDTITEAEITAYFNAIGPQISGYTDSSFLPEIGVLDAMISSLEVY